MAGFSCSYMLHRVSWCVIFILAVNGAPTTVPDCVDTAGNTCSAGHYAAPCDTDNPEVVGCKPCPDNTYSDTQSSMNNSKPCSPRRTCEGPNMTYLSRGSATSDSVCSCTSGFRLDATGACVTENGTWSAAANSTTSPGAAAETPAWVGWVIVISVSGSFLVLMLVFWFWTPCLRGEPDYGDDRREIYATTTPETEKLVNRELTDAENEIAVAYAMRRLPELVPQTPQHTNELLSILLKTPLLENQADQGEQDRLQRGLVAWREEPGRPARFADLVEAMSGTGSGQKAQILTQEVYDHLNDKNSL